MSAGVTMRTSVVRVSSDEPTEVDELGRSRYVDALASVAASGETPLVVALYGQWGSGKTSMMRQLRRRLEPAYDKPWRAAAAPIRTVWFDPWMHQFDEAPALGLLHATADQLDLTDEPSVRD